jgi:MFS family permease
MEGVLMISRAALRRGLTGWLPPGKTTRRLLVLFFVDAVGTGMFLAGSALFFTRVVGLSNAEVGLGLSLSAVIGFVCSVPIGRLSDRFGSKRTLIVLYLSRGIGFAAYLFVHDVAGFIAVACLLGASQWAAGPLVQSLVGAAVGDEHRVRTMAAMNAVRNAGFVMGAGLATLAIASGSMFGYRALVAVNALSFFLTCLLLGRTRLDAARVGGHKRSERDERGRLPEPRYLLLAAANGVLFMHTVLLAVGLPLWITTHSAAPDALVGVVVALNTVVAIGLGIRLSKGVDGPRTGGVRHLWAGMSLAGCCALVALSDGAGPALASVLLLGAAVCLTLGELWQSIGSWALSYALSPEDRRGYYLTIYNIGEPCAAMAGPVLLTVAVMPGGALGWLCLAAVFALVGLGVRTIGERASRPAAGAATAAAAQPAVAVAGEVAA